MEKPDRIIFYKPRASYIYVTLAITSLVTFKCIGVGAV